MTTRGQTTARRDRRVLRQLSLSLLLKQTTKNRMSAGTAPDATATITFNGALTAAAAIRAILHTNDVVRFSPEHWLVKALGDTPWVVIVDPRTWSCSQRFHDWALFRTFHVGDELLPDPANWIPIASWASQQWMLLQKAGGVPSLKMSLNEAAVARSRAAVTAPTKILIKTDIIVLVAPTTGTWFDLVVTKDLVPVTFGMPKLARILGEHRMKIGGCYSATERNAQDDRLKHLP